jgi:adenosylcobinamide kinase / adenosylcobinamide-phosphate guanylyltransferase
MSRIVLITGGSRSGKSAYALRLGESLEGPRAFVATSPVTDAEMAQRIERHRKERAADLWVTIEETVNLPEVIRNAKGVRVILVDCLTLWISNLMYEADEQGRGFTEDDASGRCEDLVRACECVDGTVIFVTNEVGFGIVPDNPSARRYRDLIGRCNQVIAGYADQVTLVVCGLPLVLAKRS